MLGALPFVIVGRRGTKNLGVGKGLGAVAISFALLHVGAVVAWRVVPQELPGFVAGVVLTFLAAVVGVFVNWG